MRVQPHAQDVAEGQWTVHTRRRVGALASGCIALGVLVLSGCAAWRTNGDSASPTRAASTVSTAAGQSAVPATPSAGATATTSAGYSKVGYRKVMVVVLENHSRSRALAGMPFLRSQGERYAVATRSYAVAHPSLPNYLAIAGGSTFGVHDDKPPAAHRLTGQSVFGQVLAAGGTAKTYAEAMTVPCQLHGDGRYAVKHNPWPYFADAAERASCRRFDVPSGTPGHGGLHDDITAGRLPTFSLLIPDLCNDAHDCSLKAADRWLQSWLSAITAGTDFRAGKLLVVVTFDEDDYDARNHILTVFLHPALRHATISARFDQFAVSGLVSRLVGAKPLRQAASSTDLTAAVTTAMRLG